MGHRDGTLLIDSVNTGEQTRILGQLTSGSVNTCGIKLVDDVELAVGGFLLLVFTVATLTLTLTPPGITSPLLLLILG